MLQFFANEARIAALDHPVIQVHDCVNLQMFVRMVGEVVA